MRIDNNTNIPNNYYNFKNEKISSSFSNNLKKIGTNKIYKSFDPKNATFDELCDVSMKLYEAGEISLLDSSILRFDPTKQNSDIKKATGYEIKFDKVNKVNWIKYQENLANNSLKRGDLKSYQNFKRAVDILNRFK